MRTMINQLEDKIEIKVNQEVYQLREEIKTVWEGTDTGNGRETKGTGKKNSYEVKN